MTNEKEISSVISALRASGRKLKEPMITEIAEETGDDPYQVLISCIMSLRTRDTVTEAIAPKLFAVADTPQKMARLPLARIKRIIRPINFYKTKAKRIKDISRVLVKKYNGTVPSDMEELLKLKGVGRKTANIVVVYGFGGAGIPVDTHVHRVSNRLGWVKTKTPEKTERALRALLPKRYWRDFNDLLVKHGQNICIPRNPRCWQCPVTKWCQYYREVYARRKKARSNL